MNLQVKIDSKKINNPVIKLVVFTIFSVIILAFFLLFIFALLPLIWLVVGVFLTVMAMVVIMTFSYIAKKQRDSQR